MTNAEAISIAYKTISVAIKIGGPILLLSMTLGVLISIIQAATQIHEQTLTFVPKVVAIVSVCMILGSWMLQTVQDFVMEVFSLML